jgi:hypothetical protein
MTDIEPQIDGMATAMRGIVTLPSFDESHSWGNYAASPR